MMLACSVPLCCISCVNDHAKLGQVIGQTGATSSLIICPGMSDLFLLVTRISEALFTHC